MAVCRLRDLDALRLILETDRGTDPPLALLEQPLDGLTVLETAMECDRRTSELVISASPGGMDGLLRFVDRLGDGWRRERLKTVLAIAASPPLGGEDGEKPHLIAENSL